MVSGCSKSLPTSPISSALVSTSPTTHATSVCLVFAAVTIPTSPEGTGNYVIRNASDWESYNACANGTTCPISPVDFSTQMLLVTETVYAHECQCTVSSETVTSVCSSGSTITVEVHQSLPTSCDPSSTPTPGVCTLGPVTIQAAVAVAASNLPVAWVLN
jgi:hypothetical protein